MKELFQAKYDINVWKTREYEIGRAKIGDINEGDYFILLEELKNNKSTSSNNKVLTKFGLGYIHWVHFK